MVEHQIVVLVVAGSSPVSHPRAPLLLVCPILLADGRPAGGALRQHPLS